MVVDALRPLRHASIRFAQDRRLTGPAPAAVAAPSSADPSPQETIAAWPRRTTAATPTSTSGRWCRAPTATAHRRPGRHHRPRAGRPRRHRLRAAARRRRRGGPGHADRRGRVDQVGVGRLRAGRRRRGRGQRRAGRRPGDDQRRPLRRRLAGRDHRARRRGRPDRRSCSTPTPTRRWSTRPDRPPPAAPSAGAPITMISPGHGTPASQPRQLRAPRLYVRLTLGPTGWFHDPRPAAHLAAADPRRADRSAVRRPPAARSEARGGAPRTGGDATCTALDVATRTPRAVASARSAARRSPRSGSVSRPA